MSGPRANPCPELTVLAVEGVAEAAAAEACPEGVSSQRPSFLGSEGIEFRVPLNSYFLNFLSVEMVYKDHCYYNENNKAISILKK